MAGLAACDYAYVRRSLLTAMAADFKERLGCKAVRTSIWHEAEAHPIMPGLTVPRLGCAAGNAMWNQPGGNRGVILPARAFFANVPIPWQITSLELYELHNTCTTTQMACATAYPSSCLQLAHACMQEGGGLVGQCLGPLLCLCLQEMAFLLVS